MFVGYIIRHKGYKCLHIPTARIYISRDVIFDEQFFPFTNDQPSPIPPRVAEHAILLFPHDHMNYGASVSRTNLDAGTDSVQKIPSPDSQADHVSQSAAASA